MYGCRMRKKKIRAMTVSHSCEREQPRNATVASAVVCKPSESCDGMAGRAVADDRSWNIQAARAKAPAETKLILAMTVKHQVAKKAVTNIHLLRPEIKRLQHALTALVIGSLSTNGTKMAFVALFRLNCY